MQRHFETVPFRQSLLKILRLFLAGDFFGDCLCLCGAGFEEAAGGEEFGVHYGGAGGAANEVVGEQGEFYVEERAFADAADDGGHAVPAWTSRRGWGRFSSLATTIG